MKKIRPIEAKQNKWFNSLDKTIVKLFYVLVDGKLSLVVNGDASKKMVSKKSLEECGFTSDNINFLVSNELLSRDSSIDDGFILTDRFYKELFNYGVKLRLDTMSRDVNVTQTKGLECKIEYLFKLCYESGRKVDYAWHFALIKVEMNALGEAYDIINSMDLGCFEKQDSESYKVISCYRNLFLYLLSFAANYGEKQMVDVSSFGLIDMMHIPHGKSGNKHLKQMVNEILTFKFKKAADTLHDNKNHGDKFYNHNEEYKVQFELLFVLLNKVIARMNHRIPNLIGRYVKEKQFQFIVKLLETEEKQRPLSDKEKCILLICKEIISLQEGKSISVAVFSNKFDTRLKGIHKIYGLISDKRYKEAFQECLNTKDKVKGPNLLYELLEYLNKLIDGREGPLGKNDNVSLVDELEYTKEDSDIYEAYGMCLAVLEAGISIDEYAKSCGLKEKYKQLIKLIYARICYYRAKECYDFAFDCFYVGGDAFQLDYYKAVKLFYEFMSCADKILLDVSNNATDSQVLTFRDDVENYRKRLEVSSKVKKLERK